PGTSGGQTPRHDARPALCRAPPAGSEQGVVVGGVVVVLVGPGVQAVNLDTRAPLVKRGAPGSLFGLSVALHQQTTSTHAFKGFHRMLGGVNIFHPISRMLVGAPKERAEPNVCGHRFIKLYGAFALRHMIGKCYLRGNDLQHDPTSIHWQSPDQVCSHLGDISGEVMCNMGISADISPAQVMSMFPGRIHRFSTILNAVPSQTWTNGTPTSDYSDAWSVNVKGQATLKLHTEKPSPIRMSPQTLQLSVLLLPDVGEGTAGAPLWILICSALSGLFLLSIICLLLRRRAGPWRGVSLHQGKIMGKEESHTDDFLIQTDRRRQWITFLDRFT
ncbi:hypothetical protein CRUP_028638, partial [Coryphaenoides rupestris]